MNASKTEPLEIHDDTALFREALRFHRLSCEVRPVGRGLTFVAGDIPTRIWSITLRHSLLPTSQTRAAKDRPCGLLSPEGAIRGFHVPPVRRFTYVHPTDYLALIRLVAARRVRLLRLIPRALRHFVSLSEPLFIQAPRFTQ